VTARRVTFLLVALVALYGGVLAQRGWLMVRDGRPQFVLLGIGVLLLPLLGVWVVVQELKFGRASERLARELEAEGGLPVDELPRRASGRVDRAAADAVFERRRDEVQSAPEDWRAWFRLAVAYGDAGDNARGRRAMRQAVALHGGR
jgi:cytochrome c-type biogenesis protein CcmH/NrfG